MLATPSGPLQISEFFYSPDRPLRLSLAIPTYNESKTLPELVPRLVELLDRVIPGEYELVVVDDDSPDRTWEVALSLSKQYPQVQVMRRQTERGLSTAVVRAWQAARGEVLGAIDADLQHPPEVLLQLWEGMEKGADLAAASRHVTGGGVSQWNLLRRGLSRGAQMLGLLILPGIFGRLSDPMSGYFLVRRSAIANCPLSPVGYKILIEVMARGRISWVWEVGYVFRERQLGNSKVTWKQYLEYLQHLVRLRLDLWPVGRFGRFALVGLSGVFVDLGVFYGLREGLGLGLTRSALLSAEVAIFNNFFWNDRWTFRDISQQQRRWQQQLKRLVKFNLICASGLVLHVLIVNFLFNLLGVNAYLAKLIAIICVTLWNFWFNLKLSWRVTDVGK